jgi:uncharacterized repeat protein (TIGR01451 family)
MRRNRASVLVALLMLAGFSLLTAFAASSASAASTIGSFELDGNLADNSPAGEPIDWASPPPNLSNFSDPFDRQPDTVFDTGSKDNDPAGWDCSTDGSAPGKDDIKRGQIAFRRVGGDLWAYVHFFRHAVNGDAHADFEFHQSMAPASALCPELPKRTAQDVRISFDTKNGGATINVCPQTWTGTAFVPDHDVCAVDRSLADGAVNIPPFLTIPGEKDGAFGEAAVNLTKTIGEFSCGEFAGAYMKTRAATSADAALKDFTRSQPIATGECPASTTTKTVRNVTSAPTAMPSSSVDAKPGDIVEYQIKYFNAGPGVAHNVKVTDTLAAGQTLQAGCTCDVNGSTLTWQLGDVPANTTIALTFSVQLTGTFAPNASTPVKNIANSFSTEEGTKPSTETTINVKTPNSTLSKRVKLLPSGTYATTATVKPNDTVEYEIVYTNTGPGVASGVTVTDTVEAGSSYVANSCTGGTMCSGTATSVSWTLGDVPSGESRTLTFKALINALFSTPTAEIRNTAKGNGVGEPQKSSNTTVVTVLANPTSTIAKTARNATTNASGAFTDTTTAKPGDTIEYRIVYLNTGPGSATNVVISDTIAAKQTFVGGSCTPACVTNGPPVTTVSWNLGTVAPNDPKTLTFKVTLTGPFTAGSTPVENTAVVDTTEEPPKDDKTVVTVTANPGSTIAKTARNATTNASGAFTDTTTAKPGDVIEYRIVYTNTGDAAATNVVISDTIAAKQTFVASSCTPACTTNGPPVTTVSWTLASVAPNDPKTFTFKVTLTGPFTAGSTPVENTAVVDTAEEPPKDDKTVVTVTANPSSTIAKTARNATTNPTGAFTDTTTAKPGDVIEYRIVYTNTGDATATNVAISDTLAAKQTYVASSCTPACVTNGPPVTSVSWTLASVAPNDPKTFTFKVTLTGPFTAGTTPVENTAVVDTTEEPPKDDKTVVTVTSTSNLTIAKTPSKTSVVGGDQVTYTLTYGNTGNGTATDVTITDDLPSGTSYVGCTGGTSCSNNNGTVTWTIGSVAAAGGGTVTLTVQISGSITTCSICNVAKIQSPVQNGGTAVSSAPACVNASPSADPSTAKANGEALGLRAYVPLLGIPLLNFDISHAQSSQTGPGQAADSDKFLSLDILGVVGLASVAKADVLTTTTSSQVSSTTGARQTSVSEVVGLNVLSGVVTADLVRSVASTRASGTASSYSAAGTTATNLRVLGNSVANASPGTRIPLDGTTLNRLLYGRGSYVAINDQNGSTSGPASGQSSGGTYKASLTTTMVTVHIVGGTVGTLLTLGGAPVDIVVARATAASEHKQTPLCDTNAPTQAVSGHAFLASAQVDPLLDTSTVGFVQIPASGGSANKSVTGALLPSDGSIVTTTDAAANTTGTNGATSSTASSYAQVAGACVLRVISQGCVVRATLIRSQANSSASSGARSSNATGTQFVDLVVAGIPIAGTPPPNTVIRLPLGLGFIVLNEQVPDGPETGHTGLTVRGVRAVLTLPFAPLLPGAEVIVTEAHSDATFR